VKIATVGVHVLDTHVIGIESVPDGSDGQLVETIRLSPAGTAGGTAVILSRIGAAYARMPWAAGAGWIKRLPVAVQAGRRRSVFATAQDVFDSYKGRGGFRGWPETMLADYLSAGLRAFVDLQCVFERDLVHRILNLLRRFNH
jgi:hypothetical protein